MNIIKNSFGKNILLLAMILVVSYGVVTIVSDIVNPTPVEACCGSDGGGSGSGPGDGPGGGGEGGGNPDPVPVCRISISDTTITKGDSVTITWNPQNAVSASISGIGPVNPSGGSQTVSPMQDTTYTLTVNGANVFSGSRSCSVTVTVEEPEPLPSCDFISVTPGNLPHGGGTVTVDWGTTNADTVTLNGDTVAANGPVTRNVTTGTTFTLVVSNAQGSVNCSDSVHVDDPTPTPTCDFFTIAATTVAPGAQFIVDWGTTNVTNASINQSVGSVAVDGPQTVTAPNTPGTYEYILTFDGQTSAQCKDSITVIPDHPVLSCSDLSFTASDTHVTAGSNVTLSWVWTGNVTSGTVDQSIGSVNSGDTRVVTINNDITYTTTITDGTDSVQCPLTITVKDTPLPICEGVSINASATKVDEGDDITLSWSWTQNYDKVEVNKGVGVVSNNDSQKVTVDNDTTYKIVVTRGNETVDCDSVFVSARDGGGGGGGGTPSPRCDMFEASDTRIRAGERITLKWETRRAEELTLFEGDEDDGDELFNTDDEDEVEEGEFVVRPTEDTTYTLLLEPERGSRDRTCDVDIEVEEDDDIIVLTDRNQEPRVAGIALTQVPYTGFEAGPVLTILFYVLLALWGLFVAYSFTVKRDTVLGFSLPGAFPRKQSVVDVTTDATDAEEDTSEAADYVAHATAAAPTNLPTGNVPLVGYTQIETEVATEETTPVVAEEATETDLDLTDIENRAHAQHALLSSDALRYFTASYSVEEQFDALDSIIERAKKQFPSEDGWVVINLERMQTLMDVTDVVAELDTAPITGGSLAEAIVTGNATAALTMIGNRPMIALADATTDLDALYRMRNGESQLISELLMSQSASLTDEQIKNALHALNSAMDGTYTDEADAVKTAILKAIKAVS